MPSSKPAPGKTFFYLSFLSLIILLSIISCRKIEDISLRQRPSVNLETRFFTEHTPNDPFVKAVLGFVKRENEKKHFVPDLVNKIGYPYWDKAIVAPHSRNGRTASDTVNTVFIPLVIDSAKTVNTTLIVRASSSDTNFLLLPDWKYADQSYGSPEVDSTAENVALLFMLEDRSVFGYDRFKITDPNLFGSISTTPGFNGREVRINDNSNGRTALEYEVEVCYNVYVCAYSGPGEYCTNHGYCDYMNCIAQEGFPKCHLVVALCWTYSYNVGDGLWSTGGGGGFEGGIYGGGGSGNGWNSWDPPICEEEPQGRYQTYQDCGPGWTPPGITVPVEAFPPYVINNITKPCLNAALTKLSSGSTNTFFRDVYNVFDTATNLHLLFSEARLDTVSAYGTCQYFDSSGVGPFADIKLDTIDLINCSQEWMAYVIIHEVAHAGMFANLIAWDTANTQHETMISNYLTKMATSLTAAYPSLSLYDAYAMCYAGFNNGIDGNVPDLTLMIIMLKEIKNKTNNFTITEQDLIQRGEQYMQNGTLGLRQSCN